MVILFSDGIKVDSATMARPGAVYEQEIPIPGEGALFARIGIDRRRSVPRDHASVPGEENTLQASLVCFWIRGADKSVATGEGDETSYEV